MEYIENKQCGTERKEGYPISRESRASGECSILIQREGATRVHGNGSRRCPIGKALWIVHSVPNIISGLW